MQLRYQTTGIYTLYSNALPGFSTAGNLCDGCGSHPAWDEYVGDYTVATSRSGADTAFGSYGE
jgi:hypothetical protein